MEVADPNPVFEEDHSPPEQLADVEMESAPPKARRAGAGGGAVGCYCPPSSLPAPSGYSPAGCGALERARARRPVVGAGACGGLGGLTGVGLVGDLPAAASTLSDLEEAHNLRAMDSAGGAHRTASGRAKPLPASAQFV